MGAPWANWTIQLAWTIRGVDRQGNPFIDRELFAKEELGTEIDDRIKAGQEAKAADLRDSKGFDVAVVKERFTGDRRWLEA